jgi:hypothetical protein
MELVRLLGYVAIDELKYPVCELFRELNCTAVLPNRVLLLMVNSPDCVDIVLYIFTDEMYSILKLL